jgi:hypothetical protein
MGMFKYALSLQLLAVFCGAFAPTVSRYGGVLPSRRLMMMSSSDVAITDRDVKVQQVLAFAREIGPIGMLASEEDQKKLESMSQELVEYSDSNPSQIPLRGMHDLVYSASQGSSSGRLGTTPFYGAVQQEFLDDNVTFINFVKLGPLEASLRATRSIKNDSTNLVKFHQTTIKAFGQTLLEKEIKGGGFWKYLFMGKIVDKDGTEKFVRIMETPSLFVLEQNL